MTSTPPDAKPPKRAWESFCAEFIDNSGWRWKSFELMDRIEEWAKSWPDGAVSAECDDTLFTSSVVWLVSTGRHFGKNGTVVAVFVPQCTGADPATIVLHPDHRDGLIAALRRAGERRDG